jgi:uncharacterized membrane protein YhhN
MAMFNSLKRFSLVYYGLVLVFMCSVLFVLPWLHYAVKPLFMILLMVLHHQQVNGKFSFFSKMVQFGLFFSWIGDIALMFDEQIPILFVVGLGAFLVAHVGYALGFVRTIQDSGKPLNRGQSALISVPFALFTAAFFYYIKDGIPSELFLPVLAYTVVISVMGMTAAVRFSHVDSKSYNWIVIGAVLFILSDCVIAVNKFYCDFDYDAILNMILYLSGQFMITLGAVYYSKNTET